MPVFARRAAWCAAALAFASAAVTLFWTLGGTLGLDTVGGTFEELARERSAGALALGVAVVALKAAAGVLALALVHPGLTPAARRRLAALGVTGGLLLAAYGSVLVAAGALVLTGVLTPVEPVDEHALRWHVLLWDPWFVAWGVALALTGALAREQASGLRPHQRRWLSAH